MEERKIKKVFLSYSDLEKSINKLKRYRGAVLGVSTTFLLFASIVFIIYGLIKNPWESANQKNKNKINKSTAYSKKLPRSSNYNNVNSSSNNYNNINNIQFEKPIITACIYDYNTSSIIIKWDFQSQKYNVIKYEVQIKRDGRDKWQDLLPTTEKKKQFTPRYSNRNYYCRVRAVFSNGLASSWSGISSVRVGNIKTNNRSGSKNRRKPIYEDEPEDNGYKANNTPIVKSSPKDNGYRKKDNGYKKKPQKSNSSNNTFYFLMKDKMTRFFSNIRVSCNVIEKSRDHYVQLVIDRPSIERSVSLGINKPPAKVENKGKRLIYYFSEYEWSLYKGRKITVVIK